MRHGTLAVDVDVGQNAVEDCGVDEWGVVDGHQ
jgi:hypothetical protein